MPLTIHDALFIYNMKKKGTTEHYSLTPEIHFHIRIDDSTNLPNGNLSDILQATHLYAFSTSGFCFHLY